MLHPVVSTDVHRATGPDVSGGRHTAMRGPRLLLAVISLTAAAVTAAPAAAQVYHWTDPDGVQHYSTDLRRVPEALRDRVRILESSPRDPDAADLATAGTIVVSAGDPILAEAHLNGVPLTLLVDTGASRTVISPAALARAGVDVSAGRPVKILGVTGTADAREVAVPRLDVAGTQIGPLSVFAHDVPSLRTDGLLGRDVLDQFVVTIDAARGRAILSR
jgi:hypothetical protein